MPARWKVPQLKKGKVMHTTFFTNPVETSAYRFRATHLDGRRAPKVILSDDPRIRPGIRIAVRIVEVHKPDRPDRGWIEVEFVRAEAFKLEGVYLDPVVSKKLQVLLESGLNILLDGPQGSGKTVLVRTLAATLGLEFVFFNCAAVIEASDFVATLQVRASESGAPITEFVSTDLRRAIVEAAERPSRRYLVFLDELNRSPESARNALMPALDTTRRLFDPVSSSFLDIPDNVQFVAAVNRGREFSGTFGIDAAQLDRFAPLQLDYMPADDEVELLRGRYPEVGPSQVRLIVHLANVIRSAPELGSGLSVRATEEVCVYLKHPLMEGVGDDMLGEILKSSFCGRYSGRWDDPSTDAGVVWRLVQTTLDEERGGWRKKSKR